MWLKKKRSQKESLINWIKKKKKREPFLKVEKVLSVERGIRIYIKIERKKKKQSHLNRVARNSCKNSSLQPMCVFILKGIDGKF